MINEPAEAFYGVDARSIVDVLWSSWPAFTTLRPDDVGMAGSSARSIDFIQTVQELSDAGLICYEALIIGTSGVRVNDAALTARGRSVLGSWISAHRSGVTRFG